MKYWMESKKVTGVVHAMEIVLELMDLMADREWQGTCTPPGRCKAFVETLRIDDNEDRAYIFYNDFFGNTKSVSTKI